MDTKEFGTLGEYRIIDLIITKTDGLLTCFTSFVDSCGIDYVIVNKSSLNALFLQVKCRNKLEKYNRFNQVIYESTFNRNDKFYYLFAYLPISGQNTYWLIPSKEIEEKLKIHKSEKIRSQFNFSTTISSNMTKWSDFKYSEDDLINLIKNLTI